MVEVEKLYERVVEVEVEKEVEQFVDVEKEVGVRHEEVERIKQELAMQAERDKQARSRLELPPPGCLLALLTAPFALSTSRTGAA